VTIDPWAKIIENNPWIREITPQEWERAVAKQREHGKSLDPVAILRILGRNVHAADDSKEPDTPSERPRTREELLNHCAIEQDVLADPPSGLSRLKIFFLFEAMYDINPKGEHPDFPGFDRLQTVEAARKAINDVVRWCHARKKPGRKKGVLGKRTENRYKFAKKWLRLRVCDGKRISIEFKQECHATYCCDPLTLRDFPGEEEVAFGAFWDSYKKCKSVEKRR